MCLILFAFQTDARWPLVVAANRDEFYSRPTLEADFWADLQAPAVLAGRDLRAGGTWLGVSRGGRFAAVTNIRDPSREQDRPLSRGELTREFLLGRDAPLDYAEALAPRFELFAGFNLLVGDARELIYVNNVSRRIEALSPGVHGLSNGELDCDWPKLRRGRDTLASLLQEPGAVSTDALISLMADRQQADDEELPDTGVGLALERQLSSAFIAESERGYGTTCSTGVLFGASGEIRFSERNFDQAGRARSQHYYRMDGEC